MHPYRENARTEDRPFPRALRGHPLRLLMAGTLVLCGALLTLVSVFIRLAEFGARERTGWQMLAGIEPLNTHNRWDESETPFDRGAAFRSIAGARERAHEHCGIAPSMLGSAPAMFATVTFDPLTGRVSSVEIEENTDAKHSQETQRCFQRILAEASVPPFWSAEQRVIVNLYRDYVETCFPTDRFPKLILLPSRVSFGPRIHDNARSNDHRERVIHPVHGDADDIRALRKYLL